MKESLIHSIDWNVQFFYTSKECYKKMAEIFVTEAFNLMYVTANFVTKIFFMTTLTNFFKNRIYASVKLNSK